MAKKYAGTDFNFGFNVRPRKKKSGTSKGKRRRTNPKRTWKGITFGS